MEIGNLEFEKVGIKPEFIIVKCTSAIKDYVKCANLECIHLGTLKEQFTWLVDAFEDWTYEPGGEAIIGGDYESSIRHKSGGSCIEGYLAFNKITGKFVPYESWRHLQVIENNCSEIFDEEYLRKKAELKNKLGNADSILKDIHSTFYSAISDITDKIKELEV